MAPIGWTPDGRSLLFVKGATRPDRPHELWQVSIEGGEPVRVDLQTDTRVGDVSVHSDGRKVAFIGADHLPGGSEVWVVENLLEELEGHD